MTQLIGPIVVRKYGGSSLADIDRLRAVARDLKAARAEGQRLVVVVSAMGDTTDRLTAQARLANPHPPRRELDMLLTVGERISMSLLCMALDAEGVPAVSLTGSQAGIITDGSHTDARILAVRPIRVPEALDRGQVVVVAGFRGVCGETKEITTLGRGGSDTSAVALAHALRRAVRDPRTCPASTADPKLVPDARRLERLDYDAMQRLADSGCGVVHAKAVAYAREHQVVLYGLELRVGPGHHDRRRARARPAAGAGVRAAGPDRGQGPGPPRAGRSRRRADRRPGRPRGAGHGRRPVDRPVLAGGECWSWEAWGPRHHLREVATAALALARTRPEQVTAHWDDERAVITLVGRKPENWPAGLTQLQAVLAGLDAGGLPLRTDGELVRILAPADRLRDLAASLHAALLAG
ncbi:MAG: aspartate kinase [Candidatus Krumholzibacteriia bacterium]